jgi:hypothetical protein
MMHTATLAKNANSLQLKKTVFLYQTCHSIQRSAKVGHIEIPKHETHVGSHFQGVVLSTFGIFEVVDRSDFRNRSWWDLEPAAWSLAVQSGQHHALSDFQKTKMM